MSLSASKLVNFAPDLFEGHGDEAGALADLAPSAIQPSRSDAMPAAVR
jgi:hypothetical protein